MVAETPCIYLSTAAIPRRTPRDLLDFAGQVGCCAIELSTGCDWSSDDRLVLQRAADAGTHSFIIHNYFPPPEHPFVLNLAEPPEGRSRAFCCETLELAAALGAPWYSVHAGFGIALAPEDLGNPGRFMTKWQNSSERFDRSTFDANMHFLRAEASRLGVGLLVENHVVDPALGVEGAEALFLSDPDEMVRWSSAAGAGVAPILLDLAHLAVTCHTLQKDFFKACERLAPCVGGVHISASREGHDRNDPLTASSPELTALRLLRPTFMVLETRPLEADDLREQLELLQSAMA